MDKTAAHIPELAPLRPVSVYFESVVPEDPLALAYFTEKFFVSNRTTKRPARGGLYDPSLFGCPYHYLTACPLQCDVDCPRKENAIAAPTGRFVDLGIEIAHPLLGSSSASLRYLYILPAYLRPPLGGKRLIPHPLTMVYRDVIYAFRLYHAMRAEHAPQVLVERQKKIGEEAVAVLYQRLQESLFQKKGFVHRHITGKRIRRSARAVIVSDPSLTMNTCMLPSDMAQALGIGPDDKKWIIANRPPTLHRLNVQALIAVVDKTEGRRAIGVHPLVCRAFNADFDGDAFNLFRPSPFLQSYEKEIQRMMPTTNLYRPRDGTIIALPTKEMLFGLYWATRETELPDQSPMEIPNEKDILTRLIESGVPPCRSAVIAPYHGNILCIEDNQVIERLARGDATTTVGRALFRHFLPDFFPLINLELNERNLNRLVTWVQERHPNSLVDILDALKRFGFWISTFLGAPLGIGLLKPVQALRQRQRLLAKQWQRGIIREEEIKAVLSREEEKAKETLREQAHPFFSVLRRSEAFGTTAFLPSLSTSSLAFSESTHDRSEEELIAATGWAMKRMAAAFGDVYVVEGDCGGESMPIVLEDFDDYEVFRAMLLGRIHESGSLLTESELESLWASRHAHSVIFVRTPLQCRLQQNRICATCYGSDLATAMLVQPGIAVGLVAVQAISEGFMQMRIDSLKRETAIGDVFSPLLFLSPHRYPIVIDLVTPFEEVKQFIVMQNDSPQNNRKRFRLMWRGKHGDEHVIEGDAVVNKNRIRWVIRPFAAINQLPMRWALRSAVYSFVRVGVLNGITIHAKHYEVILRRMLASTSEGWRLKRESEIVAEQSPLRRLTGYHARAMLREVAGGKTLHDPLDDPLSALMVGSVPRVN